MQTAVFSGGKTTILMPTCVQYVFELVDFLTAFSACQTINRSHVPQYQCTLKVSESQKAAVFVEGLV